jgi:hypothetical protein
MHAFAPVPFCFPYQYQSMHVKKGVTLSYPIHYYIRLGHSTFPYPWYWDYIVQSVVTHSNRIFLLSVQEFGALIGTTWILPKSPLLSQPQRSSYGESNG